MLNTTPVAKKHSKSRHKSKSLDLFNRDISLLEFNDRVLDQALMKGTPLIERVRFLAIFESNMDEFFMKRIGYLKRRLAAGKTTNPDHAPVGEILEEIRKRTLSMNQKREACYKKEILPGLQKAGVHLLGWDELTKSEIEFATEYFRNKVFPVLTPLAVDPAHPFPFVSNLSVSVGVKLKRPKAHETVFARIKIPSVLPQWVAVSDQPGNRRLVRLIDLVEHNLEELFPEMEISDLLQFRVTRNADIDPGDEFADDLMDEVEEALRQRRLGEVVRLETMKGGDRWVRELMKDELEINEDDIYEKKGELSFLTLNEITGLDLPELKYKPWTPQNPPALQEEGNIFKIMRDQDVLLHHPYESFNSSVERFLKAAVEDPKVLAIKMTLYRTEANSPFIPLLIRAAEEGKQVVCVVELKARFDEARNISWGEMLEEAGVHVVYGIVGLKTHTKLALVVRNESDGFRFYTHVGTGNYNSATARLYTDMGLLTTNPRITSEVIEVFNYLTGLSLKRNYKKMLVAPVNMRQKYLELIRGEIENKKKGLPARIVAKMNSLEDEEIIRALYDASKAGVKVQLIVRGFCCLKPAVPGLSENIKVTSIIGRFLEHSRVYFFQGGKKEPEEGKFYIASADWMSRNLDHRVEAGAPILAPELKARMWSILETCLKDKKQSWELRSDGTYAKPPLLDGDQEGVHSLLMKKTKEESK